MNLKTFRKWCEERSNLITVNPLEYHRYGDYFIEVAEGEFNEKPFYTTSVFTNIGNKFFAESAFGYPNKRGAIRKAKSYKRRK